MQTQYLGNLLVYRAGEKNWRKRDMTFNHNDKGKSCRNAQSIDFFGMSTRAHDGHGVVASYNLRLFYQISQPCTAP